MRIALHSRCEASMHGLKDPFCQNASSRLTMIVRCQEPRCWPQRGGRTFASPRRPGFRARQAVCDPDFLLAARHRLRVVARRSLAALGGATSRLQRVIASSREDEKRRPGGTRIPSRGSERDLASLPSSHPVRPTSNTHLKTASLRFSRLCTIFLQLALSRNWSRFRCRIARI